MSSPKLLPVPALAKKEAFVYQPILPAAERKAYAAAHRIMSLVEDGEIQLACRGGRRTRWVDRIAKIIAEEFAQSCAK